MKTATSGFTLVELIIVIVLLGILAVTALPRLSGKSGAEETTTQDQMISVLRRMQNQAMQQTSAAFCHQLLLTQTQLGAPNINPCDAVPANTQLTTAANPDSGLQFRLDANSGIVLRVFNHTNPASGTVQTLPFSFRFNSLGQAIDNSRARFQNGLNIQIAGAVTYSVCIESEGYIHPC